MERGLPEIKIEARIEIEKEIIEITQRRWLSHVSSRRPKTS